MEIVLEDDVAVGSQHFHPRLGVPPIAVPTCKHAIEGRRVDQLQCVHGMRRRGKAELALAQFVVHKHRTCGDHFIVQKELVFFLAGVLESALLADLHVGLRALTRELGTGTTYVNSAGSSPTHNEKDSKECLLHEKSKSVSRGELGRKKTIPAA